MMHGREKSDSAIVAGKPTNKAERSAAEPVERRAETKGNADQQRTRRTQRRISVSKMLARIRQHIVAVDTQGGKAARTDLCGGCEVTRIPTATNLHVACCMHSRDVQHHGSPSIVPTCPLTRPTNNMPVRPLPRFAPAGSSGSRGRRVLPRGGRRGIVPAGWRRCIPSRR